MKKKNLFEVAGLLERRQNQTGELQYLVQWKGYNREDATWEPRFNLGSIKNLIQMFDQKLDRKPPNGKCKSPTFSKRQYLREKILEKEKSIKYVEDLEGNGTKAEQQNPDISEIREIDEDKITSLKFKKLSKKSPKNLYIPKEFKSFQEAAEITKDVSCEQLFKTNRNIKANETEINKINGTFTKKLTEKLKKIGNEKQPSEKQKQQKSLQNNQKCMINIPDQQKLEVSPPKRRRRRKFNKCSQPIEALKMVYRQSQNKRFMQFRLGNKLLQVEMQKAKNQYPRALCNFYQKILRIEP